MRVVRPWPRLPRQAVAAPSLAVLKARLDGALNTLGWWKMSLLVAGGLKTPFGDAVLRAPWRKGKSKSPSMLWKPGHDVAFGDRVLTVRSLPVPNIS